MPVAAPNNVSDLLSPGVPPIERMSNVFPRELAEVIKTKTHNAMVNNMTNLIVNAPVTAGVKALLAIKSNEKSWMMVRQPLEVSPQAHQSLLRKSL